MLSQRERETRMDDSQLPLYTLLCTEYESGFQDAVFYIRNHHNGIIIPDDTDDENVEILLDRELSFGFKRDESLVYSDSLKHARFETIDWILKSRAFYGFQIQTAYLSLTYFDRFLSRRSINRDKLWAIRLLSVACLSLAAKMEEVKFPALSEFRIGDYEFESNVIQKMELLVLDTLQWRMTSITPFEILPCIARKMCKGCPSSGMLSGTLQHILAMMRETSYTNYRPSAVAAAATLMVLEPSSTREDMQSKLNIFRNVYLDIEDVFSCYNLMQNLEKMELITPNNSHSQDMSPSSFRPIGGVLNNSSVDSDVSNKRRRLTFNEHDQDYNNPAGKRKSHQ